MLVCAGSKTKTQKPLGLLQPLSIPSWLLWQDVGGGAAAGKADAIMPHQLKSGVGSCHVVVVVGVWLAVGMLQPSRVNKLPC